MPTSELVRRFHAEHALLMGHAALLNRRPAEALDWYLRLAEIEDSPEGAYHRGLACLALDRRDQAMEAFARAGNGPEPWARWARSALDAVRAGATADSVPPFMPAMFEEPALRMALGFFNRKDYVTARRLIDAFIERNGESVAALGLRASCCMAVADYEQAYPAALRSFALAPHAVHYAVMAMSAAWRLERIDAFEELAGKVLALAPEEPVALQMLGRLAENRNDPALARAYYQRVLAGNPAHGPSLAGLARLNGVTETG